MSTVGVGLCVVIFALCPFPLGAVLKNRLPTLYERTALTRRLALVLATILLSLEIQGPNSAFEPTTKIGPTLFGSAAMLFVDSVSLVYLRKNANLVRLREYVAALPSISSVRSRASFLALNASAAIWEEVVFRYVPFAAFSNQPSRYICAIIVSSALFGLQHIGAGWRQIVYSFGLGIFFSGLVWMSESVWASIAAHFIGNLFTIAIAKPLMIRSLRRYDAPF